MSEPASEHSVLIYDLHDAKKQSDLIYDVGLHRGEDTEYYLKKGFRVVAFEANPELVRFCRERFSDSVSDGRLKIIEGAIVGPEALASRKKIRFFTNLSGSAWGTASEDWARRNLHMGTEVHEIDVEPVDFGKALAATGIPHYLKIDIEGCDLICLEALRRFRQRPDYVSMESDKTSYERLAAEIQLLSDLGYQCFQAVEQTAIPKIHMPPSPSREGGYVVHSFEPGATGLFGAEVPGKWQTKARILRHYRFVFLGYHLLGDFGVMYQWRFRGASRLRRIVRWVLAHVTKAEVPGWYDTHACLEASCDRK